MSFLSFASPVVNVSRFAYDQSVAMLHAGERPEQQTDHEPKFSATRTKMAGQCLRQYYFGEVVGLIPAPSAAQSIGTEVHAHLERWLKHGAPPPNTKAGMIAKAGIKFLPAPMSRGLRVEDPFTMGSWPGGPTLTGTKDLWVAPEDGEDAGQPAWQPDELVVGDHKTTSGRDDKHGHAYRYALTEQTLPEDWQAVMYARHALIAHPQYDRVTLNWVYYHKTYKPEPARQTRVVVRRDAVDRVWEEECLPVVEQMHHLVTERPRLRDVPMPADTESFESPCNAYGGCPHRAHCIDYRSSSSSNQTPRKEEIIMSQNPLLASIAASKTAPAVAAVKPTLASVPPPPPPQASPTKRTEVSKAVAVAATPPTGSALARQIAENAKKAAATASSAAAAQGVGARINPPVDPVALAAALPVEEEIEADEAAAKAAEQADAVVVDAAPKGRGRPKGSTNAAKEAQPAPATAAVATPAKPATAAATAAPAASNRPFWLLVDTTTRKGVVSQPKLIDSLLDALKEQVATENGVGHWRDLDFGKSKDRLAALLHKRLKAEPLSGAWYIDSDTKNWEAVGDVLVQHAQEVFRGV